MRNAAAMLIAGYPHPNIKCDSADFSGSPACNATRGSKLTGIADSKVGIVSVWFRSDTNSADDQAIFSTIGPGNFRLLHLAGSHVFQIIGQGAGPANVLSYTSATACAAGATWRHLLFSWDLSVPGSGRVYLNDVSDKGTELVFTNSAILLGSDTNMVLGADDAAGTQQPLFGCVAELFFDTRFVDLSNVYYRRKFISVGGKPVHLGTDGSLPFGVKPLIYLHLDDGEAVANFYTNRGTGGNFTSANGTLTTGSTSPSD